MAELTELRTSSTKRSGVRPQRLESDRVLPQFQITNRYWEVVRHLPEKCKIPSSLAKIGIITDNIYNRDYETIVDTSMESINKIPEASVTPKVLSEFRRFLVRLLDDDLTESQKRSIGKIIDTANLNIYPLNADGFEPRPDTIYRGIRVKRPHEQFLDEKEYTTEAYNQNSKVERVANEKDSDYDESILDDVDPEKPH